MLNLIMAGLLTTPGSGLLEGFVIAGLYGNLFNGAGFGAVKGYTAAGTVPDSHRIPY